MKWNDIKSGVSVYQPAQSNQCFAMGALELFLYLTLCSLRPGMQAAVDWHVTDKSCADLICRMTAYRPDDRITVEEALKHSYVFQPDGAAHTERWSGGAAAPTSAISGLGGARVTDSAAWPAFPWTYSQQHHSSAASTATGTVTLGSCARGATAGAGSPRPQGPCALQPNDRRNWHMACAATAASQSKRPPACAAIQPCRTRLWSGGDRWPAAALRPCGWSTARVWAATRGPGRLLACAAD